MTIISWYPVSLSQLHRIPWVINCIFFLLFLLKIYDVTQKNKINITNLNYKNNICFVIRTTLWAICFWTNIANNFYPSLSSIIPVCYWVELINDFSHWMKNIVSISFQHCLNSAETMLKLQNTYGFCIVSVLKFRDSGHFYNAEC